MAISKAELKKLRLLNTKKGREDQNSFLVGGIRVLEEALKSGFLPRKLLIAAELLNERGAKLAESAKSSRVAIEKLSAKELENISDTKTSQGVIGIFRNPDTKLSKLYKPSMRKVLLCDQVSDPGNLGTMARTALAFGYDLMIVTDNSAEIFNPKVVRASAGAVFSLPVANADNPEIGEFKKENNAVLIAAISPGRMTDDHGSSEPPPLNSNQHQILAIGSEARGLSDYMLSLADHKISIKHEPGVESLNAAVAGGILMHRFYSESKKD